jgi:hypothetical protein
MFRLVMEIVNIDNSSKSAIAWSVPSENYHLTHHPLIDSLTTNCP